MFQYFLKVVATQFRTLNDAQVVSVFQTETYIHLSIILTRIFQVNTHQYSATHFERDLTEGVNGETPSGIHVQHGVSGLPGKPCSTLGCNVFNKSRLILGAFFNFEISPIRVVHAETRQSFAHFLTSLVAHPCFVLD